MIDERVLARVQLYGLFKALELLPQVDATAAEAIAGRNLTIEFRVSGAGRARVHLDNGIVRLEAPNDAGASGGFDPGSVQVILGFTSPAHFNAMVAGTSQPIPLKGFRYLGFLSGPFGVFTGRLEYYLRPSAEQLNDPEFFAANTRLTAYVAFHALSEIGNYDALANKSARYIPDGVIQLKVLDDVGLFVSAQSGKLTTGIGDHPQPRCVLWFKDLKALNGILGGTLNTYDGIALELLGMKGFIPMIDYINPVLGRIAAYLQ